ncbi:hypothetical protein BC936DRAFT_138922 [Jimgerdemannia flammicorona]|uniref:Uncharacterized protein n=1 Tax=Jimgerdemannia flammicorona TaxID=994334 RepID=A0A433BDU1_9FUNG|nr:hypothetical protein BC936DRAFT_138922 [Jimgerdemannia flammicorona]
MTAMIIPNAIQISTLHAKHFFASFLSREQAYDQLYEIWKAVRIGSLHTKGSQFASTDGMCSDEDDEVKECGDPNAEEDEEDDEDDDDDEDCSEDESSGEEGGGEEDEEKDHEELGHPLLTFCTSFFSTAARHRAHSSSDPDEKSVSVQDNQGNQQRSRTNGKKANVEVTEKLPAHHDPTLCDCLVAGIHYENVCLDAKYPGTVETIYNLLFTSNFVKKFLMDVEKAGGEF